MEHVRRPDFFDCPTKRSGEADVVSEYPLLVFGYVAVQVTSWALALLEVGGALGGAAHAAMDATTPIDVALCLMMFLGTLHKGPVSDGRLVLVCRIGFVVDGVLLFLNSAYVFWPMTEQHALAAANATLAGLAPPINAWGIANGTVWLGFWSVVSATVALNCLASLRRRMLDGVGPSARAKFSTAFLRAYCVALTLQLGLGAWAVANAAAATSVDAAVLARKKNRGLCQVGFRL